MKVRSGVEASSDEIIYKFTTKMVEENLQKKFAMIKEVCEKEGRKFPYIKVALHSHKLGKNFVPFILVLPESCLEEKNDTNNYNIIFSSDRDNSAVRFKQPVFDLLKAITYNKNDKKTFDSPVWRRQSGIVRGQDKLLSRLSSPIVEYIGNSRKVLVLVDPIRIFHNMLVSPEHEKQEFDVDIRRCEEIESGNHIFTVARVVDPKYGCSEKEAYKKLLAAINK